MVDGVSGTDLYRVIFDASPEPPPLPAVEERPVPPEPSGLELAARATLNSALASAQGWRRDPARAREPGARRPAGSRRAAGHGADRRGTAAGRRVIPERSHRPAAPVHLGQGIARRRQDDQERAWRHRERRLPGRDQQRLPRPAAGPRRRADAVHGSVAGSRLASQRGRGEHLREPGVRARGQPSGRYRRPGRSALPRSAPRWRP